jgi:type IV pilus assembly protein PilC
MALFSYRAKNLKGEELSGEYEATTMGSLEYMLKERGYFLVDAKQKGYEFTLEKLFGKVTVKDLAVFCRQFAVIVTSGITIIEAVAILRDQVEKKKFKDILTEIHEDIQKGRLLSEAMSIYPDVFPEFLISMIKIGEASGSLDTVMERMAAYYENDNRIRMKVKTAMTYPSIIGILTVGVVILLMVQVLPMFAGILSSMGGQMPLLTRILMAVSSFMVDNILALLLLGIFIVAAISYYFKTDRGKMWFDRLKLRLPLVKKTVVKVITSRFARSMGILLKSGIPIISSMEIMGNLIGNRAVEERFIRSREAVKQGRGIAGPMKELGIFPPLLIHMIAVGESTGELDEMLTRTAGFFDEEVEESITKLTAMVEPLMIIVLAVVVGTILLSVMLPMISIMTTVY